MPITRSRNKSKNKKRPRSPVTIITELLHEEPIPATLREQQDVIRKVLTGTLFSEDEEVVKKGLSLIVRYTKSSNNANHFRDIRGFISLTGLVSIVGIMDKWIGSQSIQSKGCGAILNILLDAPYRKIMLACEVGIVVDTVLRSMKAFPNHDRIQFVACRILLIFRNHPSWRETLQLVPGLIGMVVSAMKKFPNHLQMQYRGSQLLKHLSNVEGGGMKKKVKESEAPEALLAAIRTFKNDKLVLREARAALMRLME